MVHMQPPLACLQKPNITYIIGISTVLMKSNFIWSSVAVKAITHECDCLWLQYLCHIVRVKPNNIRSQLVNLKGQRAGWEAGD